MVEGEEGGEVPGEEEGGPGGGQGGGRQEAKVHQPGGLQGDYQGRNIIPNSLNNFHNVNNKNPKYWKHKISRRVRKTAPL